MYLHEQISEYGQKSVSDLDLLAIVAGLSPDQIRAKITSVFDVKGKSAKEVQGMGFTKAQSARIVAAIEVGNRAYFTPERGQVKCSNDCFLAVAHHFAGLRIEKFFVLLLNKKNKIIEVQELARGSSDRCVASAYEVIRAAMLHDAVGVVIAHNHPSGGLQPSSSDLETTRRIKGALSQCEITLLDHLIIHENTFYSFADDGNI
jgi:DNA repair protein RadC